MKQGQYKTPQVKVISFITMCHISSDGEFNALSNDIILKFFNFITNEVMTIFVNSGLKMSKNTRFLDWLSFLEYMLYGATIWGSLFSH